MKRSEMATLVGGDDGVEFEEVIGGQWRVSPVRNHWFFCCQGNAERHATRENHFMSYKRLY